MQTNAVKRLTQDLLQLKKEPIIGVNVEPSNNDIKKWYGIVMGMGNLYENIPIRFALEFDQNYPNSPLKAFFETDVKYNGGASYRDSSGRLVVCLNIFGNFHHVHTEWKQQQEGWSPAYSISSLSIAMQGLMM